MCGYFSYVGFWFHCSLNPEYNNSGFLDNPNLLGEFIINEFSVRNGNGEKFYKPERKAVVYERQR
jgi:hypothetical protein